MKVELYYHWCQYDWEDDGRFIIDTCDRSEYSADYILLKIVEVEIPDCTAPSRDRVVSHKVSILQKARSELQAELEVKLTKIDNQIRQLSAITYTGETK